MPTRFSKTPSTAHLIGKTSGFDENSLSDMFAQRISIVLKAPVFATCELPPDPEIICEAANLISDQIKGLKFEKPTELLTK